MSCVFCGIVAGREAAHIVAVWPDCISFRPLNPVCPGHVLVIPRAHVEDAAEDPVLTGLVMSRAAQLVRDMTCSANILTSIGRAAT
jgi:histidine triad (HIT) family protein